jgi:hypothetical protein
VDGDGAAEGVPAVAVAADRAAEIAKPLDCYYDK